jgi:hypothetical protein
MVTEEYYIRPDTCFCGMCIMCYCCDKKPGAKCCRVPFYIRNPETKEKIDNGEAYISDLYGIFVYRYVCCITHERCAIILTAGRINAALILYCAHTLLYAYSTVLIF